MLRPLVGAPLPLVVVVVVGASRGRQTKVFLLLLLWRDLFQYVLFVNVDLSYLVLPLDELQQVVLELEVVCLLGGSDLYGRSPETMSCTTSTPGEGSRPCECCSTCAS